MRKSESVPAERLMPLTEVALKLDPGYPAKRLPSRADELAADAERLGLSPTTDHLDRLALYESDARTLWLHLARPIQNQAPPPGKRGQVPVRSAPGLEE